MAGGVIKIKPVPHSIGTCVKCNALKERDRFRKCVSKDKYVMGLLAALFDEAMERVYADLSGMLSQQLTNEVTSLSKALTKGVNQSTLERERRHKALPAKRKKAPSKNKNKRRRKTLSKKEEEELSAASTTAAAEFVAAMRGEKE